MPCPERYSVRRAATNPSIANRPFQFSPSGVNPHRQPLATGVEVDFVELVIITTPNIVVMRARLIVLKLTDLHI
jgi:hypothetical protein